MGKIWNVYIHISARVESKIKREAKVKWWNWNGLYPLCACTESIHWLSALGALVSGALAQPHIQNFPGCWKKRHEWRLSEVFKKYAYAKWILQIFAKAATSNANTMVIWFWKIHERWFITVNLKTINRKVRWDSFFSGDRNATFWSSVLGSIQKTVTDAITVSVCSRFV